MTNEVESALQESFQDTSQKQISNIYTVCSSSPFTAWVYEIVTHTK